MQLLELSLAVKLAVLFSGIFLWIGMLTGVWKYLQIRASKQARAHYYVDIAHRSSLLYAPAALILAVLAYFSAFSETVNLWCIILNLTFFSFSIAVYIVHGMLKDTRNRLKQPHQLGRYHIAPILMGLAMWALALAEVAGTGILLWGTAQTLFAN